MCSRKETYICSNISCSTRVCSRYYCNFSKEGQCIICPRLSTSNGEAHQQQNTEDNSAIHTNTEIQIEDDISEDSVDSNLELDNDVINFISTYAVFS